MPTFKRVNIRSDYSYVSDANSFDASYVQNGPSGSFDNSAYAASQGYGFVNYSTSTFRSRSLLVDPSLAGMYFTSTNGDQFRLDLPDGVGTYRVRSAHIDALASQTTGWRFRDGSTGTNFANVSGTTTSSQYRDITDTLKTASGFNYSSESYVEHTFTDTFLTVTRDTSLASGNGVLSSVWVEKTSGSSTNGLGDELMWLLGDTSGSGLTNLGTTGTATNHNAVYTSKPGAGGNYAYQFPGGSIEIPSIFAGNSSEKSVAFWFYPDDTGERFYFSDAPGFTNSVGGVLAKQETSASYLEIGNGVGWQPSALTTFSDADLNSGWNHQALVFNNGETLVYLNGVLELTSTAQTYNFPTYTSTSSDKALWGAESRSAYNTTRRYKGWMDDFRQFPRSITAQEVAHLATSRGILGEPTTSRYNAYASAKFKNNTFDNLRF